MNGILSNYISKPSWLPCWTLVCWHFSHRILNMIFGHLGKLRSQNKLILNYIPSFRYLCLSPVSSILKKGSKSHDLKLKLPSVTFTNYGTTVTVNYSQNQMLQIIFTVRCEDYLKRCDDGGRSNLKICHLRPLRKIYQ